MKKVLLVIIGLLVLASIGCVVSIVLSVPDDNKEPMRVVTKEGPPPSVKAAASLVPAGIGPGDWLVGSKDVAAGTYTTPGARESVILYCYWTIKASDDPGAEVLDFGSSTKTNAPGRVKLKKGNIFETSGCQDWKLTGS